MIHSNGGFCSDFASDFDPRTDIDSGDDCNSWFNSDSGSYSDFREDSDSEIIVTFGISFRIGSGIGSRIDSRIGIDPRIDLEHGIRVG